MGVLFAPGMFLLLMLMHSCQSAVQVQDGEFAFPLESVKKMKALLQTEARRPDSASVRSQSQVTFLHLCTNPDLPKDMQPVCDREDAPEIFRRLELAVEAPDLCELCVNAACTGCY